ncbi:MAG: isoprenylcysteine carboxylmethyltransferase family protein [Gemmatimonadetes bacterium]|nr:isoprenylcysteine carboxylmethyltransferase family protein [Gemmatimonadota bacterium]
MLRAAYIVILGATVSISMYFRHKAWRVAGAIPRRAEPRPLILARIVFGLPLWAAVLLYAIQPRWMGWAEVGLPAWLRWTGAAVGGATVPFLYWVLRSLGTNISETILTKERQTLVTHGPYRWIRHPLYSGACVGLAALSLIAANWFMGLMTVFAMGMLPLMVRREEEHLRARFGFHYEEYVARTGRFVPRLLGPRVPETHGANDA